MKNHQYKHIKLSFHRDRHNEALEILKSMSLYLRNDYIAEAIITYRKTLSGAKAVKASLNGNSRMVKSDYNRIKITLHVDRQNEALEILKSIAPYWRSRYIAEAIVSYNKIQNEATHVDRNIDLQSQKSQPVIKQNSFGI